MASLQLRVLLTELPQAANLSSPVRLVGPLSHSTVIQVPLTCVPTRTDNVRFALIHSDSLRSPHRGLSQFRRSQNQAGSRPCAPAKATRSCYAVCTHSSGIVPIGAFLLEHFISNYEAFKGPEAYGAQVKFLNSLPFVVGMELFFIWIPILYPRPLRHLDLVARGCQCRQTTVAGQLVLHIAALDGNHRVHLHRAAHVLFAVHRCAPANTSHAVVRQGAGRISKPLNDRLLRRWHHRGIVAFAYGIWLFCAKWGITTGEAGTPPSWLYLRSDCARLDQLGRGEHVWIHKHCRVSSGAGRSREIGTGEVRASMKLFWI